MANYNNEEKAKKENLGQFADKAIEKVEKAEKVKKWVTRIIVASKIIGIGIVLGGVVALITFLAGALDFIDWDTYTKGISAKSQAVGTDAYGKIITLDEDGKYKISYDGKTGKEAIEAMLYDNDMNFEDFTDEEIECLYKCLKAEWATTYPNLGQEVDNKDIDSEFIQGIITIRRGKQDGTVINLTYKPYEEFTNIKDETALNYFSIKDGNLIVASWSSNEIKYEINEITGSLSEDIKSQFISSGRQISISETSINYRSMIGTHIVPFEFLFALLVNTEDVDFVNELADLALDGTIEITIYDNTSQITTKEKEHITEETNYKKDVNYTIRTEYQEILKSGQVSRSGATNSSYNEIFDSAEKKELEYEITKTTINESNSYVVGLTNVSSWLADIENNYTYSPEYGEKTDLGSGSEYNYGPEVQEENINSPYSDSEVESFRRSKESTITSVDDYNESTHKTIKTCTINTAKKQGTMNGKNTLQEYSSTTNKYKYEKGTSQTSNVGEKFKQAYDNNPKAQAQLDSVASWLFELLEETESGVDYVSVMKYLLYMCTGEDYGITEEDLLDMLEIIELKNSTIGDIYGNSTEEKIWFALKEAGYTEIAIAGVMGNIYGESGFDPEAIEAANGEGHGLCQWSYGRKLQLFKYAESKGVSWTDVNTQIEFLITEIEGTGPASGYATAQMGSVYNGYRKSDWENATTVEDATTAFCYVFERPGAPRLDRRIEAANKYYNEYKGKEKPTYSGEGITNDGDNIYYQGHYTDSQGNTFKLYRQSNYSQAYWGGTIAGYGCGPSSCAIIMSGLKDPSVSPASVVSQNGCWYGGMQPMINYLKSNGFTVEATYSSSASNEHILNKLKNGYELIINVQGGYIGGYYYSGHYYTVVDANENNEVFVIDPGPTTFSRGNNKGGGNHGWYNINNLTGKEHIIYVKK